MPHLLIPPSGPGAPPTLHIRATYLWYVLVWPLAAVLPAAPCPLILQFTTQYSGWGEKAVGLYDWTAQLGEVRGQEEPSWHWAMLLWGSEDKGKGKLFLWPSSVIPSSHLLFLQWCARTSLLNSWAHTGRLSCPQVIVQVSALWDEDTGNSYSARIMTSPL